LANQIFEFELGWRPSAINIHEKIGILKKKKLNKIDKLLCHPHLSHCMKKEKPTNLVICLGKVHLKKDWVKLLLGDTNRKITPQFF
jgi:hypothetical protein